MADLATVAQGAVALVFPGVLVAAAISDIARYIIPNALPVGLAIAFLAAGPLAGLGVEAMALHLAAGLAVLAAGFGLFVLGAMGGGDVKLLAAAAVWTGFGALIPFVLFVAIAGGLVAGALVVLRWVVPRGRLAPGTWLERLMAPRQGVPYGVAIALAGLVVFPRLAVARPLAAWIGLGA